MAYNVGDLGKLIVGLGFNKLPKVQLIAQSGHTGSHVVLGGVWTIVGSHPASS